MVTGRQVMVELLRALCVLGLLFLNLAHVPAATASDDGVLCGPSADAGHSAGGDEPCPACRLTDVGFTLPGGPVADHFRAVAAVGYEVPTAPQHAPRVLSRASARGPPIA